MPIVYIDAPPGLAQKKKNAMMKSITEAVDEAYQIGDTLIFVREHKVDNVSIDGTPQSENPKIREILKRIESDAS